MRGISNDCFSIGDHGFNWVIEHGCRHSVECNLRSVASSYVYGRFVELGG